MMAVERDDKFESLKTTRKNKRGSNEFMIPSTSELQAEPTFDIWSVGAVMYRVMVHNSLLESDDSDNLLGKRGHLKLAKWGPQVKRIHSIFERCPNGFE